MVDRVLDLISNGYTNKVFPPKNTDVVFRLLHSVLFHYSLDVFDSIMF